MPYSHHYKILESEDPDELAHRIDGYYESGWRCAGPLNVTKITARRYKYTQMMCRDYCVKNDN